MLALHEVAFPALSKHQIDPVVWARGVVFLNGVALEPETLAHEHLELAPTHAVQHAGSVRARRAIDQGPSRAASRGRDCSTR